MQRGKIRPHSGDREGRPYANTDVSGRVDVGIDPCCETMDGLCATGAVLVLGSTLVSELLEARRKE